MAGPWKVMDYTLLCTVAAAAALNVGAATPADQPGAQTAEVTLTASTPAGTATATLTLARVGFRVPDGGPVIDPGVPDTRITSWSASVSPSQGGGNSTSGSSAGSAPFSTSGASATFSLDCELMFSYAASPGDLTNGLFPCPPAGTLMLYLRPKIGGSNTVSITLGPATVTQTNTITSNAGSIVDYVNTLSVEGHGSAGSGSLSAALDFPHPASVPSRSASGDFSTVSVGGQTASISFSGALFFVPYTYQQDGSASATLSVSAVKTIDIAGILKSVTDSYPGTVEIDCPMRSDDPAPTASYSDGWTRTGAQYEYSSAGTCGGDQTTEEGATDPGPDPPFSYSTPLAGGTITYSNWVASISPRVTSAWGDSHDEYVTYTPSGGSPTRYYDSLVYMQGWVGDGLSLAQAPSLTVDDCSSATGWANATHGGGGLSNTAPGAMVRTWSGGFDFAGYRHLRLQGASVASGTGTVTLSLGSKTYTAPVTTTPTDIDLDLCDPVTGGAAMDILDTKWPVDATARDVSSGPLRGVSTVDTLSITVSSGTLTITGVEQVRKIESVAHFLTGFAPRAIVDMDQESPSVPIGDDGTSTPYAHRGLICVTDGRPSLEYSDLYAQEDVTSVTSWSSTDWPISDLIARVNSGDASRVGTVTRAVLPSGSLGWTATAIAPVNDSSANLHDGFLNRDQAASASWCCYGWLYDGGAWKHTLDMDASGSGAVVRCPVLFNDFDVPPGLGDVFGLAPSGADLSDGATYLKASKIFRAQALFLAVASGDESGKAIQVTPGAGELQAAATVVGEGTTDTQGYARTSGGSDPGLIGITGGSASAMVVTDTTD